MCVSQLVSLTGPAIDTSSLTWSLIALEGYRDA